MRDLAEKSGLGLVTGHIDQVGVLEHPAIGWFLVRRPLLPTCGKGLTLLIPPLALQTHAGSGSSTEALISGVPTICWPSCVHSGHSRRPNLSLTGRPPAPSLRHAQLRRPARHRFALQPDAQDRLRARPGAQTSSLDRCRTSRRRSTPSLTLRSARAPASAGRRPAPRHPSRATPRRSGTRSGPSSPTRADRPGASGSTTRRACAGGCCARARRAGSTGSRCSGCWRCRRGFMDGGLGEHRPEAGRRRWLGAWFQAATAASSRSSWPRARGCRRHRGRMGDAGERVVDGRLERAGRREVAGRRRRRSDGRQREDVARLRVVLELGPRPPLGAALPAEGYAAKGGSARDERRRRRTDGRDARLAPSAQDDGEQRAEREERGDEASDDGACREETSAGVSRMLGWRRAHRV